MPCTNAESYVDYERLDGSAGDKLCRRQAPINFTVPLTPLR
jgi:hypothetical protein